MGNCLAETVAQRLCDSLLEIAGDNVCAIWLYGASVFGTRAVDIDLHIVLRSQLSVPQWGAVAHAHQWLSHTFDIAPDDLDFWYISLDEARGEPAPKHMAPWAPGLTDKHWALHRLHWLAGRCVVIHGLHPSVVVVPPEWETVEAVLEREFASPTATPYWVLQLCRVWASLASRDAVRSKLDSGEWALAHLSQEYHPIVRAAMSWYGRTGTPEELDVIKDSFPSFMREVARRAGL